MIAVGEVLHYIAVSASEFTSRRNNLPLALLTETNTLLILQSLSDTLRKSVILCLSLLTVTVYDLVIYTPSAVSTRPYSACRG